MENLNFYTVSSDYVKFLQKEELHKRGFTRNLVKIRPITLENEEKYRTLLSKELRCCVNNQDTIRRLAQRTYKRVLEAKDQGLVYNSCDFLLLEEKCISYMKEHSKEKAISKETEWER